MNRMCSIQTPLGEMIALLDKDRLCELRFIGQKYATEDRGEWQHDHDHPLLQALQTRMDAYFDGKQIDFDLPLAPVGSVFQQSVWTLLQAIPAGTTMTYGNLARQLAALRGGSVPAAQAVGGAVGRNPIAIIIPCHRVIGADGSLTGYAGGLERKKALLELESIRRP